MALEFPQDDWRLPKNRENESSAEGEFFILMSLALDDMLSADEESRFHRYMEQNATLATEWQVWQDLDSQFKNEPSVLPPANFVENVAARLVMQERRSKLRLGLVVGAVTTFAWLLLVLALVGAGVYTVMYEGPWLGQQIANITEIASNMANWFSIATRDLPRVMGTVGYYQMWGVVLGYFAAASLVIVYWTRLLRHSVEHA